MLNFNEAVAIEDGPAQIRLSEAIQTRMAQFGESEQLAERALVQTEDGLRLWNRARAERLEMAEKGNVKPSVVKDDGNGGWKTVQLKPRTYTVRKFKPGEHGSQWGDCGVFDGDELVAMANILPDTYEVDTQQQQQLSEFLRNPSSAPEGRAQELLDGLISARMSERGESRHFAELNILNTAEGLRLHELARKDRLEFD